MTVTGMIDNLNNKIANPKDCCCSRHHYLRTTNILFLHCWVQTHMYTLYKLKYTYKYIILHIQVIL